MRHHLRLFAVASLTFTAAGCGSSSAGNASDASTPKDASVGDSPKDAPPTTDGHVTKPDVGTDAATCANHLAAGFTQVVVSTTDAQLGSDVSMALDENDDPMFAYFDGAANTLYFVQWDACKGAFTAPLAVETGLGPDGSGGIDIESGAREASIAYDPTTHEVAIAYTRIVLVEGDWEGVTWLATRKTSTSPFVTQQISSGESTISGTASPLVAMQAGHVYVAYAQANFGCVRPAGTCVGLFFYSSTTTPPVSDAGAEGGDAGDGGDAGPPPHYFAGGAVDPTDAWPQPSGGAMSIALDSSGVPAIAFIGEPDDGTPTPAAYNSSMMYWNSTTSQPLVVTDSNDVQNDRPDISLVFEGTSPRVAGHLVAATDATYDLTFVASPDGVTWGAPVHLPEDGTTTTRFTSALASAGGGHLAVVSDINTGSMSPCGDNPYVATSSDDGTSWTACGLDTARTHGYEVGTINATSGATRLKGTFVVSFQNGTLPNAGIVYWQGT
jgi:hypothetical protein